MTTRHAPIRSLARRIASAIAGLGLTAAMACCPVAAALALPATPQEQAQLFATCEGRYRAMSARQRADRAPDASRTEARRQDFSDLLEASMPGARDAGIDANIARRWQASGWTEIAFLLADTTYRAGDAERAARARSLLSARLGTCAEALLP